MPVGHPETLTTTTERAWVRAQCYVMCDRANVTLYACITVFAGFKQTLNRTTVGALHSVEEDPGTLARWKEYFTALLEGL